jgi:hypothetical protein
MGMDGMGMDEIGLDEMGWEWMRWDGNRCRIIKEKRKNQSRNTSM